MCGDEFVRDRRLGVATVLFVCPHPPPRAQIRSEGGPANPGELRLPDCILSYQLPHSPPSGRPPRRVRVKPRPTTVASALWDPLIWHPTRPRSLSNSRHLPSHRKQFGKATLNVECSSPPSLPHDPSLSPMKRPDTYKSSPYLPPGTCEIIYNNWHATIHEHIKGTSRSQRS